MRISEHISYKEATRSHTAIKNGIDNTPDPIQLKKMQLLAVKVFEPLRNHFNVPIKIESFFRCPQLNTFIGGSSNSQHMKGEAVDIDDDYGGIKNADMFYYIVENLDFDQIIWEFGDDINPGWVHVSYKEKKNRKKISIAYKLNGYTQYKHFYNIDKFRKFKDNLYK